MPVAKNPLDYLKNPEPEVNYGVQNTGTVPPASAGQVPVKTGTTVKVKGVTTPVPAKSIFAPGPTVTVKKALTLDEQNKQKQLESFNREAQAQEAGTLAAQEYVDKRAVLTAYKEADLALRNQEMQKSRALGPWTGSSLAEDNLNNRVAGKQNSFNENIAYQEAYNKHKLENPLEGDVKEEKFELFKKPEDPQIKKQKDLVTTTANGVYLEYLKTENPGLYQDHISKQVHYSERSKNVNLSEEAKKLDKEILDKENLNFDLKALNFSAEALKLNIKDNTSFLDKNGYKEYKAISEETNVLAEEQKKMEEQYKLIPKGSQEEKLFIDSYNELVNKINGNVSAVQAIEGNPGFTQALEDISKQGSDFDKVAARAKTIVEEKYPEIYKIQEADEVQKQRLDDIDAGRIDAPWTEDLSNNLINPIAKAVADIPSSFAYLPVAISNMFSDEYGAADRIYDKINNENEKYKALNPDAGHYEYANGKKTFVTNMLPEVVGVGANMGVMIVESLIGVKALSSLSGLAATTTMRSVATVATGYIQAAHGFYDAGIEAGMTRDEANAYAQVQAIPSALLELINPEAAFLSKSSTVAKRSAAEYMRILKKGGPDALSLAREGAQKIVMNIAGENIQELSQLTSELGVNHLTNKVLGTNLEVTKDLENKIKHTVGVTTIVSGIVGIGGAALGVSASKNQLLNDAIYDAATNPNDYKKLIIEQTQEGKLFEKDAANVAYIVNTAETAMSRIGNIDEASKRGTLPYMMEKINLEGQKKNLDKIYHPEIDKKIAELDKAMLVISKTKSDEVAQLRADEQEELKSSIPNIEDYKVDGNVDRNKITDEKVLKKFDQIYDKYDKLISPLLPAKPIQEAKVEQPIKIDKPTITKNTTADVNTVKALSNKDGGGATFNLDGSKYEATDGLMVPIDSMNTTTEELTPEMVADFVAERQEMIGDAGIVKHGIYKFPNSNRVSIDLSVVAPESSRDKALAFGKEAGQKALFDFKTKEDVDTGATGDNTMKFTPEQSREIAKALNEGRDPDVFGKTTTDTKVNVEPTEGETLTGKTTDELPALSKEEREVDDAIENAKRSLASTGIEIVTDPKQVREAMEKGGQKSSHGLFVAKDGKIYLDRERFQKGFGRSIVWHEAAHPVINILRNTNRPLYDKVVAGLKKIRGNEGVDNVIEWAQENYKKERWDDESVVESIAAVGDGRIDPNTLPKSFRQTLINAVNEFAKMLGFDQVLDDTDIGAFKKLAAKVSGAIKTGKDISSIVGKDNVKKFEYTDSKGNVIKEAQSKKQSLSNIDINKVRSKNRPGKKVSKGLSVKMVDGKKVIEETEDLSLEYVKENAPRIFISNANIIAKYPLVAGKKKFQKITTVAQAQEIYDIFIREVANNLNYLMDEFKPEFRDIATLWYDGANSLANDFADKFGISSEQASGIIASMSPQKDWYQNVRLAEMVMMAYKDNPVMTQSMIDYQKTVNQKGLYVGEKSPDKKLKKAEKAYKKSRTKLNKEALEEAKVKMQTAIVDADAIISMLGKYIGKKLNDTPQYVQPYMVRTYHELNTTKDYNIIAPDGSVQGVAKKKDGSNAKVAWGSYSEIGKAVSIINDGSQENITKSLGQMHKIRNFHNNIIDPMSKDGDVTMDTHAIAAALLLPLSGNSIQVGQNFGTGTSNSGPLGIKGLYYAYAEGYALAAKEAGLLPRQIQSITWEAVRGLYTDTFKKDKNSVEKINNIWKNYENGKITVNEARKQSKEAAGGIKDPTWAGGPIQEESGGSVGQEGIGTGSKGDGRDIVGGKLGGDLEEQSQASTGERKQSLPKTVAGVTYTELSKKRQDSLREDRSKKEYFDDEVTAMKKSKLSDEELKRIVKDEDFGILTGQNPDNTPTKDDVNEKLNKKAEEWISEKGYTHHKVTGRYNQTENSFLVPGLTADHAVEFAKEFNQESVVTNEGLIYQDGTMNPREKESDSFDVDVSLPDANYASAVRTKDGSVKGFSVGIDFDGPKKKSSANKPNESQASKGERKEVKGKVVGSGVGEDVNPIDKGKGLDNKDFVEYNGMFSKETSVPDAIDNLMDKSSSGKRGYQFFYKGRRAKVEMMSPDEYLKRVKEGQKSTDIRQSAMISESQKDAIRKAIKKGNKIDMPFLEYNEDGYRSQEGRHRALVAKEMGEKLIPVLIEGKNTKKDLHNKAVEILSKAKEELKTNDIEQLINYSKEKYNLHHDAVSYLTDNKTDLEQSLPNPEAKDFDEPQASKGERKKTEPDTREERVKKINDRFDQAEQNTIEALRSLKLGLVTPEGSNVTKQGMDLEDLIKVAFTVARQAVIIGGDIKVAIEKTLKTLRDTKAYQDMVTIGSAQDISIGDRITDEVNNISTELSDPKIHAGAKKVLADKFVNQEIKDGLIAEGIEYRPVTVEMQSGDAKKFVEFFESQGKLEELEELIYDDNSGLTSTTRVNIATELLGRYSSKGKAIQEKMKLLDKDSSEYKSLSKESGDLFRKAGAMFSLANSGIGSEAGKALNAQKELYKMLAADRVDEVVNIIRMDAEATIDKIVEANKKKIAKSIKQINDLWDQGLRGDSLKRAIKRVIEKNLLKSDIEGVDGLVDQVYDKLSGKGSISATELSNRYRTVLQKAIISDEAIEGIAKHMEVVKLREEQKKLVDEKINDYREELEEASRTGVPLTKEDVAYHNYRIFKEWKALEKLDLKAQEAIEKASKPFKDPRDFYKTLTGILKMRLLSPLSLFKNISGYLPYVFIHPVLKVPSSVMDWAYTKTTNLFRGDKVSRSQNFLLDSIGYKTYGFPFAFREAVRRFWTGKTNPNIAELDTTSGLNSVTAWTDIFRHRRSGERGYVENKISAILEAISPDADMISRLLAAPDVLVRKTAERGAVFSMAKNQNLSGPELWDAIINPPKEVKEVAEEIGARAAYQNKNEVAKLLDEIGNKTDSKYIGRHIKSLAKFLLKEPNIPFVTTPINIVSAGIKLTMWPVSLAAAVWNIKKSHTEQEKGNKVKSAYYRGRAIESFSMMGFALAAGSFALEMLLGGALTGAADKEDKDIKSESFQHKHPNSLNYSAVLRKFAGNKDWSTPALNSKGENTDTWISLAGLGPIGVALSVHANVYQSMDVSERNDTSLSWNTLSGIEAIPAAVRSTLDQTYLAGAHNLMDAIFSQDPKGTFMTNYLKTISTTFLPNTLAAMSRSSSEYMRDTKGGSVGDRFKAGLKERLFMGDELPTKVTVWGSPVSSLPPGTNKYAYYFLDPFQSYNVNTQSFKYLLFDFYNNTGIKTIIPTAPENKIVINKEPIELSPKEYEEYQTIVGKMREAETEKYVLAGDFKTDDQDTRVATLNRIYDGTKEQAKRTFIMNNERLLLLSGGMESSDPREMLRNMRSGGEMDKIREDINKMKSGGSSDALREMIDNIKR